MRYKNLDFYKNNFPLKFIDEMPKTLNKMNFRLDKKTITN